MGTARISASPDAFVAWQPLTFAGVAAFAHASLGRLLLVASLVSLLVSAVVGRFVHGVWSPAVTAAIEHLPARGEINDGRLLWTPREPLPLVDTPFLSIRVHPAQAPAAGQSADVQLVFGPKDLEITSLLGYVELPYPPGYRFALNRTELEPLWGAWRPHVVAGIVLLVFTGLLVMWGSLATALWVPLRTYSVLLGRQVTWRGCWKLAVAALLPGALVMGVAIVGYTLRRLSLGELVLINGLHLLVGTAYLLIAPLRLPGIEAPSPFSAPPAAPAAPTAAANPFAGPNPEASPPPRSPVAPELAKGEGEPNDDAPAPRGSGEADEPLNPS